MTFSVCTRRLGYGRSLLIFFFSKTPRSNFDLVHDAYRRFSHEQLVLFLQARNLSACGSDEVLAHRLTQYDLQTYHFPSTSCENGSNSLPITYIPPSPPPEPLRSHIRHQGTPDLPVEIIAEILDHLKDWELSTALGLPTLIPKPLQWQGASSVDHAILSGDVRRVHAVLSCSTTKVPTNRIAVPVIRFAFTHVLEYLFSHHPSTYLSIFEYDLLPTTAAKYGRIPVLAWWKRKLDAHPDILRPPSVKSISGAIDEASRNGRVASLEWWLDSGLPFEYTEAALELASAKNRISVLDWWLAQSRSGRLGPNRTLKVGKVMDTASTAGHVQVLEWWARSQLEYKYDRQALYHASCNGKVDVLQWWSGSGLQMIFDQEALTGATKFNRREVLEWWDTTGLPIQYRTCDIEEALEDSLMGGEAVREWWARKGLNFRTNDKEWMKLQYLNPPQ
jgi:hypothetical protein